MVMVTLVELVIENGMTPSRAATNKGCRNERELLRYRAHIGVIYRKKKWEWEESDQELNLIRGILDSFKNGKRAPSNWRKLPETPKEENKTDRPEKAPSSSQRASIRPASSLGSLDAISISEMKKKKQKTNHRQHDDEEEVQELLIKPAPNDTQGGLSSTPRSAIRHPVVKFEHMEQGLVKCPNCNIGIAISKGCSVATCRNHNPSYLYFCIYCKQPAPEGYSTCTCPKRSDKQTRIQVLQTPTPVHDDDGGNDKEGR
jgi:hypothetical protein